ncbi:GNAT family N-acetyltransferase [Deinococcus hopiensis]|uniref:Ribosomal protein S18 acetylase RimI n=1 Tax=Deinococcus hopiensis KR-140 TaxID=695939 RepID=A0A1W1VSJ4_9DEIO|nr:N-acetyltransferase [Deinococcus hopiensis]SMB96200.1 Ribosomal protein S18 acetylase RimI [Deinococcus hopiensis KR-140]
MPDLPQVRVLTPADAPAYREVRLTALRTDPLAFSTTAAEFEMRPLEEVVARLAPGPVSVTFGAFLAGKLVGLLTVAREERPALTHRANVFGVSVLPAERGQGCGDALLRAGLAQVRSWKGVTSLHLGVMETQGAALSLYGRHGFQLWGTQPDALRINGRPVAEHHLWLALTP